MKSYKVILRTFVLTIFGIALATPSFAQGSQTGLVRGVIKDDQGLAAPTVTVTATSTALQGTRVATTAQDGAYTLRALPPGDYTIKFERDGFATATRAIAVTVGMEIERNVTLHP